MSLKTPTSSVRNYFIFALMLGFISISTQVIVLRELLSVYYGNELVIGIVLTNWMLLTGLGAYIGKLSEKIKASGTVIQILFIILAILPFILTFLAYYLRNILFEYGTMINLFQVFYSSLLLLLPFCIISGFLFTFITHITGVKTGENLISKIYGWESLGSIGGGILFNVILIWFLSTFESLLVLGVSMLLLNVYLGFQISQRWVTIPVSILLVVFVSIHFLYDVDKLTHSFLFKNQQIEYFRATPYGNITVTKTEEQFNFYENNLLLFSTQQPVQTEQTVHIPFSQTAEHDKVLLLSGSMSEVVNEINKYPVQEIDYVEINPWFIRAEKKIIDPEIPENLRIINKDARYYIEHCQKKYDIVILNLPEPTTAQVNRFYTHEFFSSLKQKLSDNAVISFSLSGSSNYLSEETRVLYSSVYNTLRQSFKHVKIIPANSNFFLASDKQLSYNVTDKIHTKDIQTKFVNKYYLNTEMLQRRGEKITKLLNTDFQLNRDFKPITYFQKLNQWSSYFQFNFWLPFYIILIVAVFLFIRVHPVNFAMFAGGYAGASMEVILLIAFQLLYGYVYNLVGIIVTIFMAGLAVGTYYRPRILKYVTVKNFNRLQLAMILFSFILPLLLILFRETNMQSVIIQALFMALMFVTSLMVGLLFSIVTNLQINKIVTIASGVYSIDLIGAAIGSFITTVYIIPRLGLINACFITGTLIIVSLISYRLRIGKQTVN
jgi:spermidine synthase